MARPSAHKGRDTAKQDKKTRSQRIRAALTRTAVPMTYDRAAHSPERSPYAHTIRP